MENIIEWIKSLDYEPLKNIKSSQSFTVNTVCATYLVEGEHQKFLFKFYPKEILARQFSISQKEVDFLLNEPLFFLEKISQDLFSVPKFGEIEGKRLFNYKNYAVFFYEFIEGRDLLLQEYQLDQIEAVGKVLGHIHRINYREIEDQFLEYKQKIFRLFSLFYLDLYDKKKIQNLVKKQFGSLELFHFIEYSIKHIKSSNFFSFNYKKHLNEVAFTHQDLKPKNIVWSANRGLSVLDWETCLVMYQSSDLLTTLASFSYQEESDRYVLKKDQANAFLKGYSQIFPKLIAIEERDLYFATFNIFPWLINNSIVRNNEKEIRYCLLFLSYLQKNFDYFKTISRSYPSFTSPQAQVK